MERSPHERESAVNRGLERREFFVLSKMLLGPQR